MLMLKYFVIVSLVVVHLLLPAWVFAQDDFTVTTEDVMELLKDGIFVPDAIGRHFLTKYHYDPDDENFIAQNTPYDENEKCLKCGENVPLFNIQLYLSASLKSVAGSKMTELVKRITWRLDREELFEICSAFDYTFAFTGAVTAHGIEIAEGMSVEYEDGINALATFVALFDEQGKLVTFQLQLIEEIGRTWPDNTFRLNNEDDFLWESASR